jgi:hypothetical protein
MGSIHDKVVAWSELIWVHMHYWVGWLWMDRLMV